MITAKAQLDLFKVIGDKLKQRIECIAIGGTAMMLHGVKESTKDIDLVFIEKSYFKEFKKALFEMGFDERDNIAVFKHYEMLEKSPIMMENERTRFDLFLKEVICFKISETMLERIEAVYEFGNLIIKVLSPEDIILLKCATERERDRADAMELIKKFNINWDIIIKESAHQTEIGKDVFPVLLYDFLLELKEDMKADIPDRVIKKIRKIGEKQMIKVLKRRKVKQ